MNHVYRLKRSGRTQQLQPVPETARAAGKGSRTSKTLARTVGGTLASFALSGMASLTHAQQAPPAVNQLPQGGVVTRGSANIVSSTNGSTALMTVNQSSQRAVIDWASFNVGSQAKVQFNQPGANAVVLNNILGNNASQIYGQISANGQVFLSNPNGVYFSPTAQVNVGGLVATTGKANADEFMAGKASFNRAGSTGSVVNEGQLTSAAGGYIALLAPEVRNQGVVVAQAGTVALASGEAIMLSFNNSGTGLAGITTTPQTIAALVENRSAVLAEGGQIILSAHALAALQGSVVKNSGQLSATSLSEKGGKIVLMADSIALTGTSRIEANGPLGGGTVLVGGDWQGSGDTRQATRVTMAPAASIEANATQQGDGGKVVLWSDVHNANSQTDVAGTIQAEGRGANSTGGQIETSGARLRVSDSASIRMGGEGATGGRWLLDPTDFTIAASGGDITGTALAASISAGNTVEVLSSSGASGTAGNINVNDAVSWSNTGVLKLTAAGGVTGASAITMSGAAGTGLVLDQAGTSTYSGTIAGANATVTKQGAGALTLSGANTYRSTVISQGTLRLGSSTALGTGTAGTVTLSAGATLDLNGQTILSTNAKALNISGSGVSGAGALINSSATAATYPGLLTLGAGTAINATSGGIVLSNIGTITGAGFNLTLGGAATGSSIAGIIGTGTGSVTKQDAGTWTLTGTNTYTGGTNFNGGNLVAGSNGALGSSGTLSFAGGTLVYGGSTTDYSARLSTAANQVYVIDTGSVTIIWATSLTAAGSSLIKSGGGILRLDAANGLSGGITVRQGTLFLGNSSGLGTGPVVVNTGAAIDLNGKTVTSANPLTLSGTGTATSGALLNTNTTAASFNGLISLAGNTTIGTTLQGGLSLTNTGAITGSGYDLTISGTWANSIITLAGSLNTGGGRLIKTGNSELVLSGTSNFTGGTSLSGGTLVIGDDRNLGAVPATPTVNLTLAGGTTLRFFGQSSDLVLSANRSIALTGNATLRNNSTFASATIAGAITGSANLTLTGIGIDSKNLVLSGANSLTGNTTINTKAKVVLGSTNALGSGSLSIDGATLDIGAYDQTVGAVTLSGSGGNAAGILGTGGVLTGSSYTLTSNGNTSPLTVSASLGGSGALTASMTSTSNVIVTLSGNNSFSGGITLNGGVSGGFLTLRTASPNALGTGPVLVNSGTTLDLWGQAITTGNALTLNGTGMSGYGALANVSSTADASFNGPITLGSASTISAISVGRAINLTHTGNLDNAGFDLTLGLANGSLAGSIVGGGGLIKSGIGTWVLSGNSTYTGATTINVGTLQIGNGGNSGALPAASAVNFGLQTGALVFNRVDGASITNTIGSANNSSTISNVAYGSTLDLSGATLSSYTGTYTATLNEAVSAPTAANMAAIVLPASPNFAGYSLNINTVGYNPGFTAIPAFTWAGTSTGTAVSRVNGSASSSTPLSEQLTVASNSLSIGSGATWSFLNQTGGTTTYYYTTSDSAGLTLTGTGAAVNVAPKAVITQSGTVTGGVGLTVSGAGTFMMSGANDYTGGTSVSAGTIIKAGSATAFGTGAVTVAASGSTGGAVDLNGQTMTSTGTLTLRGTGVSVGGVSTGALFNSSSTTASYAGLVALASASSILGDTGGIILSNTSATGITGNFALTLGGAQGGRIDSRIAFTTTAGTLTKQDAGIWTLNGASTITGTTTISAGVLKAGHANAFGPTSGAGGITVSSGAALDLNGQAVTSTGTLTLNGTGINNGGALMNSGAAASYAGLLALGADSSIVGGSGTIALGNTGTINGSGKNLTLGGAQGGSIAGIINTGAGTLTKQDTGTWALTGVNSFTGMVTVNAGTLQIATDSGLGAVPGTAAVKLTLNGGTLASNNSIDVTLNANRLIAIGSNGGTIVNGGTSTSTLSLEGAIAGAAVGSVTQGPLTITGGDIRIGANISMGAYDLLVKSTGNIFQGVATTNPTPANVLVSTLGAGHVTYWADSDASGAGAIQFRAGTSNTVRSSITTAGGNIVLGGGSGATAADGWARGLYAVNLGSYSNLDAGTGSITLKGMTNATTFGGTGVLIDSNSTLNASTIRITGNGNPTNTFSDFGVFLKGGTSVTASSLVNITGTGGGTASSAALANTGVRFDDVTVSATGSGNVVITGDGGGNAAGGTNYGIQLLGSSAGSRSSITADTGTITITGMEGASAGGIGISATVARIGAASQTGLITVRANSLLTGFLSTAANNSQVLSSGVVNMEPLFGSASFVGRGLDLTYMQFGNSISSLTLGKAGNTGAVTFGTLNTNGNIITGPITAYGDIGLVNDTASSTGITLNGSVLQTAGRLSTPTLLLTGTGASNVSLALSSTYGNAIGTVAGSGLGTVNINNGGTLSTVAAGALTVGAVGSTHGLSASGPVTVTTYRGDITLADNIVSSNAGTAAITLNAGQYMPVGDTTSGNLIVNNGGSLTTGSGGRALLYTGAVSNAGLTALVGSGSGRFRYGSTSGINNFTNWLGTSGFYAIYRERPTASWSSTASQTFNYGNTPVIDTTGSVSGLVNGDTADTSMTVRLASTNTLTSTNARGFYNVGSYIFSRTEGAKALGYQVSNPTMTVNRATLTVTANDFTKTYDGVKFSGGKGVTYSGFATGETAANALSGSVTYGGTAQNVVDASASTYSIVPSGLSASNYTITYVNGALTVNPATLTVRINNDARFVADSETAGYNGASYSGFVAKQNESVLGGALTISRSSSGPDGNLAGANTQPGSYTGALTGSGLTSTNYTINYVPGNYTIVPADQLLVKMANATATYGSDPAYSVTSARYYRSSNSTIYDLTSSVVLAGSSFSLNDGAGGNTAFTLGAASPALSTAGQLNVGAYQVGAASITNTSVNYSNTITITGSLQVGPKPVTAAVTSSVSKTYDGTPAMNGLTLAVSGAVTGDAVVASGTGTYASKNAGNPVAYTVSNIALSGTDSRNYVLTDSVTTLASNTLRGSNGVITAVPLSITANNESKVYDGNAYSGGNGVVHSGFVNNETEADLSGSLSYGGTSQGATNVGSSYTIIPSGYTSSDYTISYTNGTLSITPVVLSVTPITGALQGSVSKGYDGNNTATLSASNYLLTGWATGEGATVTKTTGTYDNANAGSGKTVTVALVDADYTANVGTTLSNYTLPTSISGAVGSISKAALTATGNSASVTYNGANQSVSGFTVSGLQGSDTVASLSNVVASGATGKNAGSYTNTVTAGTETNYTVSTANGSLDIAKANATVTANSGTLTYNGANQTVSGFTASGLVGGEMPSVLTGVTASRTEKNAGTYTTTASGTDSNYHLAFVDGAMVINKAALTATGNSTSVTYNGANQSVSGFTVSGLQGSDTVASLSNVVASGATGKNAGSYTNTVTAGTETNYTVSTVNGSLDIAKANATVTASSGTLTYNGADQTVSGFTASGLVGGEMTSVLTGVTASRTEKNAGTYTTTASGTDSNYHLAFVDGAMVINKAALTATGNSASVTYNGANQSVSGFTVSGLQGSDTQSSLTSVAASGATGKNAGNYANTVTAGTETNYTVSTVNGSLDIAKANATVTANSGTLTYNGANQTASGFTASGLVGGEMPSVLTGVTASRTEKNAGTYTTTASGTDSNYHLAFVDGAMVINKAALTATGNSTSVTYNGANQSVSGFTVSGLQGNDTEAGLTGISASGVTGFNVGAYANTMTVVDQTNYTVAGVNGSLLISAAPITAIQGALQGSVSKVYDSTTAATLSSSHYLLTGWLGSDMATVTKTAGTFDTAHAGSGKTVTVSLTPSDYQANGSTNLSNYALPTTVSGAVGQITKASVTPTITASDKVYDTTTVANGAVALTGVYSADALAASAVAAGYSFANAHVGTGKTVTASGITLGAGLTDNYVLSSTTATGTASITPAPVTVTARNAAKFVTQTDPANFAGYAVTGLLGSETPASAGITAGVSLSRSNDSVHLAAVYPGVLLPSGAAVIGNYAVRYVPGTFTIVPAGQLLVETTSTNTAYGTASLNPIASVSYLDGSNNTINPLTLGSQAVVNGATVYTYNDGASGTASFSVAPTGTTMSASGQLRVGSYGLVAGHFSKTTGNLQSNTATVTGNLTVQPLAITVAATPSSTTYNSTTQTQAQTSGVLGGDAVTVAGAVRQRNAGSYTSALSATGADVGNYSITYGNSNFTINPAVLNTSVSAADKVYDGRTSASLTLTDNRFGGDAVSVTARGQFDDKNVGANKSVAITGLTLSGADASNYSLSAPASTTASISRLAQVTWVGGTTGSWFDPANWAGGAVPDLANVANVTIPAGVTVSYDNVPVLPAQAGPVNVDSLGTAGSLTLSAGSLNVGLGGVTLNTVTQTGGTLTTTGALALGSLSQTAGSLSAGSLSTTTAFSQTGTGTLAVSGNAVIAATAAPVVLGNLRTGGGLSVSSTGGSITQSAGTVLTVTGQATLTASQNGAPADVMLGNTGNVLTGPVTATGAEVSVSTTGPLSASISATGNATLNSGGATTLGATTVAGDLNVNSTEDVTQTAPVSVAGTSKVVSSRGQVVLDNPDNRIAQGTGSQQVPSVPVVLTPALNQGLGAYHVTVLKLPPPGSAADAGLVHISLRDSVADAQIVLPEEVQRWIRAAGAQLEISGAEGVTLSDAGDAIRLLASAERNWPTNLSLQSGLGALNIRIVKAN